MSDMLQSLLQKAVRRLKNEDDCDHFGTGSDSDHFGTGSDSDHFGTGSDSDRPVTKGGIY